MKNFTNKVAVITGAGSGMGRYLAVLLAKAGANVAICEINPTTLAETEATVMGAMALIEKCLRIASWAKTTPAMGALKPAEMAAATPQPK